MPQSYYNSSMSRENIGLGLNQLPTICPNPLTPPPEDEGQNSPIRSQSNHQAISRNMPSADNTAAGMARNQEDSIYLSPAPTPEAMQGAFALDEKDKMDTMHDEYRDGTKTPLVLETYDSCNNAAQSTSLPSTPLSSVSFKDAQCTQCPSLQLDNSISAPQDKTGADASCMRSRQEQATTDTQDGPSEAHLQGLAPIDLQFDRSLSTKKPWSFSNRRLLPEYPSHVFQPFSRYSGTQQSDRQMYNVDVTILTVDVVQCTMTGYLLIRGLTPEHDTLQTYFTGEIIGGPAMPRDESQSYTFRTANLAWGATEKTDLTHWSRFPAWRPLAAHAKRDINFAYPTDGGTWREQENIFMRWKEHFLVPDHKTKSIAGASFEGFYYICLNQLQGRISGIYYHSKSEKFQQLELRHEGKPDIFNRGVTPCVEFR